MSQYNKSSKLRLKVLIVSEKNPKQHVRKHSITIAIRTLSHQEVR